MKTLIIRADADQAIGIGHAMRCLALAQAWNELEGRCLLVATRLPSAVEDRYVSEQISVVRVDATAGSREDLAATLAIAEREKAYAIALDGYDFDADFSNSLRNEGFRLLVIDDCAHQPRYSADLVLNQNLDADANLYQSTGIDAVLLLGCRYAMLRREFRMFGEFERQTPAIGRKVLVTLGGTDPHQTTGKVVEALAHQRIAGLHAIILSGVHSDPPAIAQRSGGQDSSIEFRKIAHNMPELLQWADFAVAAGGSTSWERAYFGLPSLTTAIAENQVPVVEACERHGLSRNLGWHAGLTTLGISKAIRELSEDQATRQSMAEQGRKLVDGMGAERVAQKLMQKRLRLRSARFEDARLLYEWAMDPAVRELSFDSSGFTYESHIRWLQRRLHCGDCALFVAVDAEDRPLGQIRFDREGGVATISVSVDSAYRGRGLGAEMIASGISTVRRRGWQEGLVAWIKPENQASLAAFQRAGFKSAGVACVKGQEALRLIRET